LAAPTSATRHDRWDRIYREAIRWGIQIVTFLGGIGLGYSTSVAGFIFVRFLLGLGESGNFPASIKTVAAA
jgi:MFS family permease